MEPADEKFSADALIDEFLCGETPSLMSAVLSVPVRISRAAASGAEGQDTEDGAADPAAGYPPASYEKIRIRPVRTRALTGYQLEKHTATQVFHENVSAGSLKSFLKQTVGHTYRHSTFETERETVCVRVSRKGKTAVLRKKKPETERISAKPFPLHTENAGAGHDRTKKYLIPEGDPVPFLVKAGVMTEEGKVAARAYDKFRQINRFLEYIDDILDDVTAAKQTEGDGGPLTVVDFGCGKSYLTFAVYYFLTEIKKIPARITGLDLKKDVIEWCNTCAGELGCDGLRFFCGDIASFGGNSGAAVVIPLHACDTATDIALAKAVHWQAKAILSVPCCQHELNAQLSSCRKNRAGDGGGGSVRALETLLKHGIVRERFAALATDVMRAELLEREGYRVRLLEFIDMTHTPKNILIRAVRRSGRQGTRKKTDLSYTSLRDFLGARPALEKLLEEKHTGENDAAE